MNEQQNLNQTQNEEVTIEEQELEVIAAAFHVRTGLRAGITPCV